jgi:hypothetical protein
VAFETLSYFMLVDKFGAKPLPVTVTDVPTGPDDGPKNIPATTLNEADAELLLASVASIGWEPLVEIGITIVEENPPSLLEVTVV